MRYYLRILLALLTGFLVATGSYAQTIPTGVAITPQGILDLTKSVAGFLFMLGGILAVITIIMSGLTYFTAGSNQARIKLAKDIFKAGLIGTFILFGSGMIIRTIEGFSTNPFKFFGGGGGNNNLPNGSVCSSGNDCQSRYCNLNMNPPICQ